MKPWIDTFNELHMPEPMSGCWLWTGTTVRGTYGKMTRGKERKYAHRFSWEYHHGPIPEGMCVCHKCDVPSCVNPDHLFLGTASDNTQDMLRKGRNNPPKGSGHYKARLTEDDARFIKRSEKMHKEIAAELGVRRETVTAVKVGRTWKHVE